MPMYEFQCNACEEEFEELVRADDEVVECPACGTNRVTRKLSTFAYRSVSGGTVTSSSASHSGGGCSGCASHNCGSCSH